MRKAAISLAILAVAVNAQAGPKHVLTAVPRAVGRTAENMFTFKDPGLAVNEWILMAAVLADAKTSLDLTRRCPDPCENYGSVWGAHPSAVRVYGTLGLTGIYYSTINQVTWEVSYDEPNSIGRSFERYFPLAAAVVHAHLAVRNTQVQPGTTSSPSIPPSFSGN